MGIHSLHKYGKTSRRWDSEIAVTVIMVENKVIIIIIIISFYVNYGVDSIISKKANSGVALLHN